MEISDTNIWLQFSLTYHKVSKTLSHRATWTASWLPDIIQLFFQTSSKFFSQLSLF